MKLFWMAWFWYEWMYTSVWYVWIWSDFNEYLPLKSLSFNFMFIRIVDMSDYGLIFKILGLFSGFVTPFPPHLFKK